MLDLSFYFKLFYFMSFIFQFIVSFFLCMARNGYKSNNKLFVQAVSVRVCSGLYVFVFVSKALKISKSELDSIKI